MIILTDKGDFLTDEGGVPATNMLTTIKHGDLRYSLVGPELYLGKSGRYTYIVDTSVVPFACITLRDTDFALFRKYRVVHTRECAVVDYGGGLTRILLDDRTIELPTSLFLEEGSCGQ